MFSKLIAHHPASWLGAVVLVSACTGNIGDGVDDEATDSSQQALCESPAPGPNPMRRLTSYQYANTVRELFGSQLDAGDDFPETEINQGFRSYANSNIVSSSAASGIQLAAEHVAAQAATDLSGLLGCDPDGGDGASCIDGFVRDFAKRAYRRPPSEEEVSILQTAYDGARLDGFDASESVSMVIEAVLQSPQFLYRVDVDLPEGAQPGDAVPLDTYQVASRLSYLLWDSMPDAELFQHADDGSLDDAAVVEAQARRMLADPRAKAAVGRFVSDWMQMYRLDAAPKDTSAFPEYTPALEAALQQELTELIGHVMWGMDGRLETLLSTPVAMVNQPLASLYGVSGPADVSTWAPVELDESQRAGLLTTAAFLASNANATQTNPVVRGAFVRAQMLCQVLHPPEGLMIEPISPDPTATMREKLAQHRDDPACSACHDLMDPIGFGLENYDALGKWRDTESNGSPIDASGELADAGSASGSFEGGVELAGRLAQSDLVHACYALQTFRFATGRENTPEDRCSIDQLEETFAASDGNLIELLVGLTQTDAFRYRIAVDLEEAP